MPKGKSHKRQSNNDVCVLCENGKSFTSLQDFWVNGTSLKQKLILLQVDKNFVLKQIRSSNLYNPNFNLKKSPPSITPSSNATNVNTNSNNNNGNNNNTNNTKPSSSPNTNDRSSTTTTNEQDKGDKPAVPPQKKTTSRKSMFSSKSASCLCPACKKRKAIFNVVVKVFEDYIEELECRSCGKPIPQKPIPTPTLNSSVVNISTTLSSKISNVSQLPFGDFLVIKNDKLTVSDAYLSDGGVHFYEIMKKCSEIFPDDAKLQPHQTPSPENIHMLINYCTMNSELNIKNIMLKAKKTAMMNEMYVDQFALIASSINTVSDSSEEEDDDEEYETGDSDSDDSDSEDDDEDDEESEIDGDEEDDGSDEECDEDHEIERRDHNNLSGVVRGNTQESRLLFQIYLARIFAHNVNIAYKNVVALQAQEELLQGCAFDDISSKKKAAKQQPAKKNKNKKQQQQKKKSVKETKPQTKPVVQNKVENDIMKEDLPPLEQLKEASGTMMTTEDLTDEWNVVQHNKAKTSKSQKTSTNPDPVVRSSNPSSRSSSPTLSSGSSASKANHKSSDFSRSPRSESSVGENESKSDGSIMEDEEYDFAVDEVFTLASDTTSVKHNPIGYELKIRMTDDMDQSDDIGYVSSPFDLPTMPFFTPYNPIFHRIY